MWLRLCWSVSLDVRNVKGDKGRRVEDISNFVTHVVAAVTETGYDGSGYRGAS